MKAAYAAVAALFAVTLCNAGPTGDVRADAEIQFDTVTKEHVLPALEDNGIDAPMFKFFDRNGKLIGLQKGRPTEDRSLKQALAKTPSNLTLRTLSEEMKLVGLTKTVQGQTVVAYVMNGRCTPCADILETVKQQLASIGWQGAQIIVVNIQT